MHFKSFRYAYNTRKAWLYTATSRSRARFARTTLGSFWLGFSNLLSIAALGSVYGTVFAVDDFKAYIIYLGFGLVVWNSLSSAINSAPQLFLHNAANIKNMNVLPLFYTLEEWAFQLQTFFQSFSLVFITLLFFDKSIFLNFISSGLLPVLNFIIFIYWFPLIICLICVWYTDLCQLVPILLQIVFLVSPILYRKESLGALDWIVNYNFVYKVLEPLRESILVGVISYREGFILLIINLIGLVLSVKLLNKNKKYLPFVV